MGLLHQGPGVFFLFVAFVLLIIVSVSVPVWNSVYFLKAAAGGVEARFGNWGTCVRSAGGGFACSAKKLGYRADNIVDIFGNNTGDVSGAVVHGLTYALVLHPIAAGITLFAMIISLTTNWCLDICGSLFAFFAFLVCLVAFIVDSVLFVTARSRINDAISGSPASLSNAYWMVLAALVSLLLAALTVCCGSMSARRNKRRSESYQEPTPVMGEKRHFWQRKRY